MLVKYVIVLKKKSGESYYFSIKYLTNGINRIFSRYFASAFFFDSKKSAMQEFKNITDNELTMMLRKVGVNDTEDQTSYQVLLCQVSLQETDTFIPMNFQTTL